jgi:two-component system, cell cycle sensor histidine kinase and response regulator CckA
MSEKSPQTDSHQLQAQLYHAQKMDAIGQLAAGIAHDFNNLLLVISSYSELGMEMLPSRHPVRWKLQEILNASHRAAALTRQLLAFAREQVQTLQDLDLNNLLQDFAKLLSRLLGENIEFQLMTSDEVARVKLDPVQFEQILLNLANNARDAMPEGGKFTIQISKVSLDGGYIQLHPAVSAGDYVLMTVSDTGQGIAPEHLPRVFEPFFTTKPSGKGTGLGLATVYGIVKQCGGHIWVYSEPGLGTSFKIYLPVSPSPLDSTHSATSAVHQESCRGSETILFVEDEECVRLPACEFLSHSGYHVLQAADGLDAIRVAQAYDGIIHLLVTDVVMPQMSGNALAARFWQERPETRVLYLSGYPEPVLMHHGITQCELLFLEKPYTLKTLGVRIRQALSLPSRAPGQVQIPEPASRPV